MGTSYAPVATVTGERDALIEWLLGIANGCIGSDQYLAEARAAAGALASGAMSARAGHTVYRVED